MLEKIIKITLTFLFFMIMMPISLVFRLVKLDIINKNIDEKIDSYWETSSLKKVDLESLKKQR